MTCYTGWTRSPRHRKGVCDERNSQAVHQRRLGGGHPRRAPGRHRDSRAQESAGVEQECGAAVGRSTRAGSARARQAEKPAKEEVQQRPTLEEFAPRFLDGYAQANRLKPSGIAAKKTVLRVHLVPLLGNKRLDELTTEDVQRLKSALSHRAAKTVNNVLTVLSVMLRTAVDWDVITRIPCAIKLLRTSKSAASFYDFEDDERLVEAARSESQAYLVALLGGEAGLRCGAIMALEWTDVDLAKRQLCVASRSGRVTSRRRKAGGSATCRSRSG
jgi:integrase